MNTTYKGYTKTGAHSLQIQTDLERHLSEFRQSACILQFIIFPSPADICMSSRSRVKLATNLLRFAFCGHFAVISQKMRQMYKLDEMTSARLLRFAQFSFCLDSISRNPFDVSYKNCTSSQNNTKHETGKTVSQTT